MAKPEGIIISTLISLALLLGGAWNPAVAANSTNYEIRDAQVGPSQFRSSSGGYMIDGSIEAIVKSIESNNYKIEDGSPTRIDPVTSGGSGGVLGATACGAPGQIGIDNVSCTRIYKNLFKLSGTKAADTNVVLVNGDVSGLHFGSDTTWDKTVALTAGQNIFNIVGQNECGDQTQMVQLILEKVKMGDINNSGNTDDYDLSLLTRKWDKTNDCYTDFNRDLITNDYDLSLMASAWG